jgi:hypothetical protein
LLNAKIPHKEGIGKLIFLERGFGNFLGHNRGVANQPKTPITGFRIPEDLKSAAQAKAAENGETLSDVVRRGLVEYVAKP